MTESRVELLSADEASRIAEEVGVLEPIAQLNVFRVLLHRPQTAKAVADLLLSMLFGGALDDRLRELVIMRIGWATGSDYEWTQHWTVAQEQFACTPEDLLAVRDWRDSDRFGPAEQAVLAATDETLETGSVTASTLADCRKHVGETEVLVELITAIGTWRLISQFTRSLEVPLEEGIASWPPEGVGPK